MWFDNHCHLTGIDDDVEACVRQARRYNVDYLMTVGCTVEDSQQAAEIAAKFDGVWSTAGVHPHEAESGALGLAPLLEHPSVAAVGECGLDYHYNYAPKPAQVDAFKQQIELAHRHELPLVIHTREAWDDTFEILDAEGIPPKTVFHCFTGGVNEATKALDRGAYLSFSGIVTFPSAADLREAALVTPLDRIVVETDSPYLTPVPHRGKPNSPGYVSIVGEFLADLLAPEVTQFAAQTTANAMSLYCLDEDLDKY